MTAIKWLLFLFFLAPMCYAKFDPDRLNKAITKANSAYTCAGGGPDSHTATIAAYWVEEGDTIFDVGAHFGIHSLFYKQLVGLKGFVVAYEASPPIYHQMHNKLRAIQNIISINKACSDTTNQIIMMKMYPSEIAHQCATVEQRLWYNERMPGNTAIISVLTETIDDFLKEQNTLPPVRFIKIDTEGHEHAVIRGAKNTLLKDRPLVVFEYGLLEGIFATDSIRQLEELGYACYDSTTRVYHGYNVPWADLLAIPIEFEEELKDLFSYLNRTKLQ